MNRLYGQKRHLVKRVQSDFLGAPGTRGGVYCANCSATAQDALELIGKVCTPSKPTRKPYNKPYTKCQEAI